MSGYFRRHDPYAGLAAHFAAHPALLFCTADAAAAMVGRSNSDPAAKAALDRLVIEGKLSATDTIEWDTSGGRHMVQPRVYAASGNAEAWFAFKDRVFTALPADPPANPRKLAWAVIMEAVFGKEPPRAATVPLASCLEVLMRDRRVQALLPRPNAHLDEASFGRMPPEPEAYHVKLARQLDVDAGRVAEAMEAVRREATAKPD
jgi:hypothetical protein